MIWDETELRQSGKEIFFMRIIVICQRMEQKGMLQMLVCKKKNDEREGINAMRMLKFCEASGEDDIRFRNVKIWMKFACGMAL